MNRFDDSNYKTLLRPNSGFLPRLTTPGSPEAVRMGLVPVADYPSQLVKPADYKAVIEECHAKKIFAMYHQERSGVFASGWSQQKFRFCWAYGLTAAVMDCRALQGQEPVRLAPFSLVWLVNWKNQGFYCDRAIAGANERGIASAEFVPQYNLNYRSFKPGWEKDAMKYRPDEWWDAKKGKSVAAMLQYCVTMLCTGVPLYCAYIWWGHALEIIGLLWDETVLNNIAFVLRNSHNEKAPITLSGSKSIPDEIYGVRAGSIAA